MINNLPSDIRKIVDGLNYSIDNVGRSKDKVINFENKYILKISDKKDHILKEKNINDWLINKIPCSKNIIFEEYNNKYYYLRTCLDGDLPIPNHRAPILMEARYRSSCSPM